MQRKIPTPKIEGIKYYKKYILEDLFFEYNSFG